MPNDAATALGAAPAAAPAPAPSAAPAAAPSAAPAAAPAAAPSAAPAQWYDGIQNPELKNWVQAKGFKDPAAVAESTYNLEKLVGFEKAGRTLVLPKDDATPEEIRAFHAKLGVPDKPDGYMSLFKTPEAQNDPFNKEAAKWFHEIGIPPKQAEQLLGKWQSHAKATIDDQLAAFAQQSEADFGKVTAAWGKDADANIELGKRAAAQFIPAKTAEERQALLQKIERAIGTEMMLNMFAQVGKGLGEHQMVNGQSNGFGTSPAQAQAKITALKSDPGWTKAYLAGDKGKIAEMENLVKIAHPVQQ